MRLYFYKNPRWLQSLYKGALWSAPDHGVKSIYLTFDDGPAPDATPWVVEQLRAFNAKGTFFVNGQRAERYPDLLQQLLSEGHAIGNHGYLHLSGWSTNTADYLENLKKGQRALENIATSRLFRPPYGRMKPSQLSGIKALGYSPVMWTHLSGDFDQTLDAGKALKVLLQATSGSIIVFHDSFQARENLHKLLPEVLLHFSTLGYHFKSLDFICD
ncbi:polysaccharide deacetylase family protein [Marinoscillum furvescens]|uniref:Peptidoglycan/xylan/chitin deacetylase (PgdA/CDA1 family) n=1 Tax=Marinoscillum furvescens DSM 4134 TaxID=1122208 RepID=A0A3D9LGJ1_MARFU|nr:polysaccharide deacetylase family protein [Marinoscillum furvescens]REE05727.1 peptidoglycan/xylan/chitin deacetylase (PgdA/CDA1 family) [Marinoscillum furvescens DSM 4134]